MQGAILRIIVLPANLVNIALGNKSLIDRNNIGFTLLISSDHFAIRKLRKTEMDKKLNRIYYFIFY